MSQNTNLPQSEIKWASEIYNQCPRCDCQNLLKFEGEAFCLECDWDSIALSVDRLGMGALFRPVRVSTRSGREVLEAKPAVSVSETTEPRIAVGA